MKTVKIMRKGEQTRVAILEAALDLASRDGLEGLTIGLLAERMQMSKSGVFAHFGSREDLQVEVVRCITAVSKTKCFSRACASRAVYRVCAR